MAPQNGRDAVWEYDLEGSGDVQLVFANQEVDVDQAITWPSDHHLTGFFYETDRPHAFYIDDVAERVELPGRSSCPAASFPSSATRRTANGCCSPRTATPSPLATTCSTSGRAPSSAHELEPALEKATLAPMKTVTIKSGDLSIPGYLTLPLGKDPKNLPTVIYPHGGPYVRDSWGYDPMVQMMVSRGYAVLQVNFRGSTGYGQSWFEAGYRGWGTVIHDDITAGARWLIGEGIADPSACASSAGVTAATRRSSAW